MNTTDKTRLTARRIVRMSNTENPQPRRLWDDWEFNAPNVLAALVWLWVLFTILVNIVGGPA